MRAALASEWRKTFSTRIWWILLLTMVGYLMFIAAMITVSFHFAPEEAGSGVVLDGDGLARLVYSLTGTMAYVFPALIGALSVTSEYRHQTLTPTFLAEPRRAVVLGAKMLAAVPVGLAYALAATAATVGTGAGLLAAFGQPTGLGAGDTLTLIGRGVIALTVWAVIGVGFGALLRQQATAIVVLLVFTQLVEPLLRAVPAMLGTAWKFTQFLPGAAGDALAGQSFYASMTAGPTWAPPPAVGGATLLAYAALFAVAGYALSFRRDVT
ncbi:MAG: hypothetical protein LBT54_00770 [Bifidobacteriaceae bacterium]|jgi:ABC-type transport system involved in multi-copper enzyme maturation permease subunit|nr:hypothetical protein [Bifidobacteriaceae bacterium]